MPTIAITTTGQALLHGPLDLTPADALRVADVLRMSDLSLVNLEATVRPGDVADEDQDAPLDERGWHRVAQGSRLQRSDPCQQSRIRPRPARHPPNAQPRRSAGSRALQGAGSTGEAPAGRRTIATARVRLRSCRSISARSLTSSYASAGRAGINPLRVRRTAVVPPPQYATFCAASSRSAGRRSPRSGARGGGISGRPPRCGAACGGVRHESTEGQAIENDFEIDDGRSRRVRKALAEAPVRTSAIVVVALHNHHWDPDWTAEPRAGCSISRARLIDKGADLVFGTGAPVLQGVAFHRGQADPRRLGQLDLPYPSRRDL